MSEISRNLNANMQTRQITNAMYLLSVSEIRRMSGSISYIENYMHRLRLTIRDIITRSGGVRHSFLQRRGFKANASAFFVISSDKSLCGAYNVNIVNLAMEQIKSAQKAVVITAGSHGETMLRNRGVDIRKSWEVAASEASLDNASDIADDLIERYLDGEFDEVYVAFTRYRDQAHQYPTCVRLFPLALEDFADEFICLSDSG